MPCPSGRAARCRLTSHSTSRPNDHSSSPSAAATSTPDSGTTPAAATTSATPCTTATALRATLGGRSARSQGAAHAAAPNRYRIAPIASTHAPADHATSTLSTSTRKASVSMSNRAPSLDAVPVRRATCPSTPSRTSASDATATSAQVFPHR